MYILKIITELAIIINQPDHHHHLLYFLTSRAARAREPTQNDCEKNQEK